MAETPCTQRRGSASRLRGSIPITPKGLDIVMPGGSVLGEADRRVFDSLQGSLRLSTIIVSLFLFLPLNVQACTWFVFYYVMWS